MASRDDFFSQLMSQGLGQALGGQASWATIPQYGITSSNVPNTTPSEAEPEFNLVLLTGDDDEA